MIGHDVEPQAMTVPTGQGGFRVDSQSGTRVRIPTPRAASPVLARTAFRTTRARRTVFDRIQGASAEWGVPSRCLIHSPGSRSMHKPHGVGSMVGIASIRWGGWLQEERAYIAGKSGYRCGAHGTIRSERPVETRTIAEDGSQSFARSGECAVVFGSRGRDVPMPDFVQMMGERGPGERVGLPSHSRHFRARWVAKQSYTGRLVERDGQFHFLATEGGAVRRITTTLRIRRPASTGNRSFP